MEFNEAKLKFICEWGSLSNNWGVCRTMGQLHALLLVSPEPLCADEAMKELKISRGNVNMNLRSLIDWGLVYKVIKQGERKEFFKAEKNIWTVFRQIVKHRKQKELDPMIKLLNEIAPTKHNCVKSDEFCRMVKELKHFSEIADHSLQSILASKENFLVLSNMQMLR